MNQNLPEIMLAVLIGEIDGQLTARHIPIPRPGPGDVLVKIAAAPINPSDLSRIKTVTEPADRLWFVPGIEGSGTVVSHGRGLLPGLWQGRRVACTSHYNTSGTWAEYMVTPASRCIPIPTAISDEQGAMFFVNPMTAVAFLEMAKKNHHKAIINTVAASSLGRIVELLARKSHIPLIQIVRNSKQKSALTKLGNEFVLDSSDKNFEQELHLLSHKLDATLAFDAVGGKLTRQIFLAIPPGSSVVMYGNLSGEQPEIDYRSLVADNKKISGFFLVNHLKESGFPGTIRDLFRVRNLLAKGLTTAVQIRFPLEMAQRALEIYLGNMTGGKVLLMPEQK